MAVPTLTTITPDEAAPASEEMVKLEGSGYNIPSIPVPEAQYPGVRVWFNGRESENVKPVTSAIIYTQVPRYLGSPGDLPDAVDVRIANIDANGDIIVGEDETFTDAFTYKTEAARPPVEEPFFALAIREMILEFQRQTGLDVHFAVHPDYQDEVELKYFEADIPCIGILDLAARDYPYKDLYGRVDIASGVDEWEIYRDTEQAEFDVSMILVAGTKDELFRYYDLVRKLSQRTKYLYVPEAESTPDDRVKVKFRLDLDGDLALSYRQVLASMAFSALLGPCPIESPEVLDRAWEAVTIDYDVRNSL